MKTFKQFLTEMNLHPDVLKALQTPNASLSHVGDVVRQLKNKGISSGISAKGAAMGGSRTVLPIEEPATHTHEGHRITVDGKPAAIRTVLKIANPHDHGLNKIHMGVFGNKESLGEMQNRVENGTINPKTGKESNDPFRILSHDGKGNFTTNKNGIFPPLISHHGSSSVVGFAPSVSKEKFKELSGGMSIDEVGEHVMRNWNKRQGTYIPSKSESVERELDEKQNHPLVKKITDYINHPDTRKRGVLPHDLVRLENWGNYEGNLVVNDHGQDEQNRRATVDAINREESDAMERVRKR